MFSSDKTLLGRLGACTLVLVAAFMLWLAVWLLQQIWLWLVGALILIVLVWVVVVVWRSRRDRWLR